MTKLIKMVWTSKDNCLFIYGITEKGEVIFRTTNNIKHLQKEVVAVKDGKCYTNLYHFNIELLNGLPMLE